MATDNGSKEPELGETSEESSNVTPEAEVAQEDNGPDDEADETEQATVEASEPPPKADDKEGDCWDVPVATSASMDSAAKHVEEVKKEVFEPGDHVIRWEMLPIAWPIQVHGIVLNAYEDHVLLVDFGMSAPPADKNKPSIMSSNPKQVEQAIRNFKIGGKKPEKNRLNIHVLSDPKDIAKWKKVNYDGGWFGSDDKKAESAEKEGGSPSKAQKTKQWLGKMATSVKDKTKPLATKINEKAAPRIDSLKERARPRFDSLKEKATSIRQTISERRGSSTKEIETEKSFDSTEAATETPIPNDEDTPGPDWLNSAPSHESNASSTMDEVQPSASMNSEGSNLSDFSSCQMNPKMKELLQKKQEENPPKTMNPAMEKILNKKADEEAWEKKKKESLSKLPKADPAKLVLARTHWLLQHGEAILPPYHAFSSNSECLAVFCKTGHWNTLQADVFLHSTAIGNAKTFTATTIGVAASVPLLAPVVGLAGIAAVGAPWLYLSKQKNKAVDAQQRLTDAFWAQAENEIFVECIQCWSKDLLGLEDSSDNKDENVDAAASEAKEDKKKENGAAPEDEKKEDTPVPSSLAKDEAPIVQSI